MTPNGIVSLLTDFGSRDPFVGVLKAVLLGRARSLTIVDLCHEIEAQDVRQACYWLHRSYAWFPPGTTHVAVVDPGVGSTRAAIVARASGHYFVAPDNGLLTGVLAGAPDAEIRRIDLERHGLDRPSATFHGRDVFAPLAAELAAGRLAFADVGPAHEPELLALPAPRALGDDWLGEVVSVDRFGNLLTNLGSEHARGTVEVAGLSLPLGHHYADAAPFGYVALINAWGDLEIARRDGNAAQGLGAGRGTAVRIRRGSGGGG